MSPSEAQLNRARYIRAVLAWHDLTQHDLGRILGCSQVHAGRKLRGVARFSDDELLVIADTFGLDPGFLLRPPPLEAVLGAVSDAARDLLTCTKYQVLLDGTSASAHYGHSAKSSVIQVLRAA